MTLSLDFILPANYLWAWHRLRLKQANFLSSFAGLCIFYKYPSKPRHVPVNESSLLDHHKGHHFDGVLCLAEFFKTSRNNHYCHIVLRYFNYLFDINASQRKSRSTLANLFAKSALIKRYDTEYQLK